MDAEAQQPRHLPTYVSVCNEGFSSWFELLQNGNLNLDDAAILQLHAAAQKA